MEKCQAEAGDQEGGQKIKINSKFFRDLYYRVWLRELPEERRSLLRNLSAESHD